MAKLGFAIGRGLNLAGRFAAGAGALDGIGGAKGSLLDTAKNIVGGGQRAGAGASLSDRVRGGFSAISPGFAKAENVRSMIDAREAGIKSQGISDEINKSKLDEIRQTAVDKETPFDLGTILSPEMMAIPGMKEDGEALLAEFNVDGKNGTSVHEFKTGKEKGETDGSFQKKMINFVDTKVKETDVRLGKINTATQPLLIKLNTSAEGVISAPGSEGYKTLDDVRADLKDPQLAGSVDKALAEQVRNLDIVEAQKAELQKRKDAAVASMSTQQALQVAQTAKLNREAAEAVGDDFESTKIIESISRAENNGRSYSELSPDEQKKVIEKRLQQDPERLKVAFAMKKQFDGIEGIKNYKKVQVNFDIMSNTIERVLDGSAPSNIATDQTLVNTLNKIMDPASVVRESEFERTGQGEALRVKLEAWTNKVIKGGIRLTDSSRQELVDQAEVMMKSHRKYAQVEADRFGPLARSGGIDPLLITGLEFQNNKADGSTAEADAFFEQGGS